MQCPCCDINSHIQSHYHSQCKVKQCKIYKLGYHICPVNYVRYFPSCHRKYLIFLITKIFLKEGRTLNVNIIQKAGTSLLLLLVSKQRTAATNHKKCDNTYYLTQYFKANLKAKKSQTLFTITRGD